jgi:putative endonuclease
MRKKGNDGEKLAIHYLEKKGFSLIESNVYSPFGEIDLVMKDKEWWVFIEVKLRNNAMYGHSLESITEGKKHKFTQSVFWYLQQKRIHAPKFRIDVVGIDKNIAGEYDFSHILYAF